MRTSGIAAWAGPMVLASACGASSTPVEPALSGTGKAAEAGPMAMMLAAIRTDASQRAGLPADEIAVGPPQSVTWSDGSLGCPQPDRLYTQALVPGWRIEARAKARALEYHANTRGVWLFCPADRVRLPAPDSRI